MEYIGVIHSLKLYNVAPENGWLEYDRFLLGPGIFAGAFAVSFREKLIVTSMGKTAQTVGTREISQCDLVMNRESLVSHVKHRRHEGGWQKTPKKTSQKSIIQMRNLHKKQQVYRTN